MRAAKKPKAEKQRAPFPKGRNAVAHPLAPEDNNKRAFNQCEWQKNRKQKNNAPRSQKGATLLLIRSLRRTKTNARLPMRAAKKTKAEKQRAPIPKRAQRCCASARYEMTTINARLPMRASKKRKQKNNAPPRSKKSATLLRIRSLRNDNNKRAFTNASGKKNESRKTTPLIPKRAQRCCAPARYERQQ